MKQIALRPHDVAVILQLVISPHETYANLSYAVGLSASEVHQSTARLRLARLLGVSVARQVRRKSLEEFIVHGVRYAFPAELGATVRGVPTAHSAPRLSREFNAATADSPSAEDVFVWPHEDGPVRGTGVTPLYAAAARTAKRNSALYDLLTLIDAIRIGRARERRLGREMLLHALNVEYA